ncbi:MAG: glycoside hydrolase family 13 protein [Oscillospiraceae bacterium]|nr:glycoside hydrolase family 13 protein [Oscillospiraceae bacterium]
MHEIRRKVCTYGGYEELWSEDYKLRIRYEREREYELELRDGVWCSPLELNPLMLGYLRTAAAVVYAAESCELYHRPLTDIGHFLPKPGELLPEELLRFLMDDRGFGMEEALRTVVKVFGRKLCGLEERDWLFDMQPRTAALNAVLRDELSRRSIVLHEPFCESFRSPAGAVEEGTETEFSVCTPGNTTWVTMHVRCEAFSRDVEMEPREGGFVCRFTPPEPSVYFYSFFHSGGETESFQLTACRRGFDTPEWFRNGIMYQVFPDRFGIGEDVSDGMEYHRSLGQTPQLHGSIREPVKWQPLPGQRDYAPDDFYGGTLRGITKKLPYLRTLGVSILYLNPIAEARSNHRYDTSDYERVDPILGTNEDYVNLCQAASELGIRIINDGVFSHTGADSRYFDRFGNYGGGACEGRASPYYEWYDFRRFPEEYRCWWGFKDLPEVNELNPAWQDYIVSGRNSIVKSWLRLGASGWRIDVADELPDEVLSLIRSSAREEKPDAVIIGEVWEDPLLKEEHGRRRRYALGDALDSVMNYPFRDAVLSFAVGSSDSYELRDFLRHQQYNYPKPMYAALMNLLGSHDVERLHTYLAMGRDAKDMSRARQAEYSSGLVGFAEATKLQRLCAAIQYSVPGVPCLYYGDEECLEGCRDPFNRMPFEPKCEGLHKYYAKLAAIRNQCPAMRSGSMRLEAPTPDILLIIRENGEERLICVINRSGQSYTAAEGCPLLCGSAVVAPKSAEILRISKKKAQ